LSRQPSNQPQQLDTSSPLQGIMMNRKRTKRRGSLKPTSEQLVRLATGLSESGSRAEDHYWENQLSAHIDGLLANKDEDALNAALDHLYDNELPAHQTLADCIEACVENPRDISDQEDVLLLALPFLAWSRFRIPTSAIPPDMITTLRTHLHAHVASTQARIALADLVFSPDQLPQGYCATAELATELAKAALAGRDLHVEPADLPETLQFLSDIRYILACVAVPKDQPFFAWQESRGSREQSGKRWQNQVAPVIAPLFVGSAFELVLPETYFSASRQADRHARPHSLRASIAYLSTEFSLSAANLHAVIAPFHDRRLEEYRIGFVDKQSEQVVHGVVWPLLGAEDENTEVAAEIETVLRACDLNDIVTLEVRFPLEYCDDCGAPLYPSPEGEIVHTEPPEEHASLPHKHLH